MNITEALEYIHAVSWKGSVPGLSRIGELLSLIGSPEKKMKYIHIVGTNGKGSTAAMLSSVLKTSGYKVGMYTSPFITVFNERMQINGEMISDAELAEITEFIKPYAESMSDKPTEFELITAVAFEYFHRNGCDIVILEAGMGGEFDATNVIPAPEVAVITNIGLDHTEFLGDTLEKIAATKSGVVKKGCDCVLYPSSPEVEAAVKARCDAAGTAMFKADFDSAVLHRADLEGQIFDAGKYKELSLPLLGAHQIRNCAVVLCVIERLNARGYAISEEDIRHGLKNTVWQGRFEILSRDPLFIVDGGHNSQCIEALAANIRDYLPGLKLTVLTGVLADKDYRAMYDIVAPYVERFVLVTPPSPRALDAARLADILAVYGRDITVCNSVESGVKTAVSLAGTDGTVLAFGSLYMIGDIKRALLS
ncbi:MAG: bifunctional folylpolyglutamate synthase/dihydrofolate synthase [Clostridia bacterium]|nr:bifunctional folylpolyglutamate synthase/dihydrofolate synthase [Clostridia bacterium]